MLSSEEKFLDVLYLGIFVILSPAFDPRFYLKPSSTLINEVAYAIRHFYSLMHIFSLRFIIFLGGEAVAPSYIMGRMLAEFAAAAVFFARSVGKPLGEGNGEIVISFAKFLSSIESILQDSRPDVLPYFLSCTKAHRNDFLWTGPEILILPRSEDIVAIIPLTVTGELLDLPDCPIYPKDPNDSSSIPIPPVGKRRCPGDSMDVGEEQPKKRKH